MERKEGASSLRAGHRRATCTGARHTRNIAIQRRVRGGVQHAVHVSAQTSAYLQESFNSLIALPPENSGQRPTPSASGATLTLILHPSQSRSSRHHGHAAAHDGAQLLRVRVLLRSARDI